MTAVYRLLENSCGNFETQQKPPYGREKKLFYCFHKSPRTPLRRLLPQPLVCRNCSHVGSTRSSSKGSHEQHTDISCCFG